MHCVHHGSFSDMISQKCICTMPAAGSSGIGDCMACFAASAFTQQLWSPDPQREGFGGQRTCAIVLRCDHLRSAAFSAQRHDFEVLAIVFCVDIHLASCTCLAHYGPARCSTSLNGSRLLKGACCLFRGYTAPGHQHFAPSSPCLMHCLKLARARCILVLEVQLPQTIPPLP